MSTMHDPKWNGICLKIIEGAESIETLDAFDTLNTFGTLNTVETPDTIEIFESIETNAISFSIMHGQDLISLQDTLYLWYIINMQH